MVSPIWSPSAARISESNMTAFAQYIAEDGHNVSSYQSLHDFSIRLPQLFWKYVWNYASFIEHKPYQNVLEQPSKMPNAKWFTGSRFNFAENLLKFRHDHTALIAYDERGKQQSISYAQLYLKVAKLSQHLKEIGIQPGDKIAAFSPNIPEAIIAMLACTSLGAVWSSCSPDFGTQGVLDRFGQIQPKILITTDGYFYNGKKQNNLEKLSSILSHIPSIQHVILVPYSDKNITLNQTQKQLKTSANISLWDACLDNEALDIEFSHQSFDHPLYILYSSGTTGSPKCIVHSAGGTLIQHYKELVFHTDVKQSDTVFYYTTCGWMMWNWMVSTLMTGATLVIYDGSPFFPEPNVLWNMAETENISIFGTSAKYISALEKAKYSPNEKHSLKALKTLLSTGSPLSDESFEYIYNNIKQDICVSSIAGGTDIVSCFTLGNPNLPVYKGEIQCLGLGMAVNVYDDAGQPVKNNIRGELVCEKSFPSMPIGFYNDTSNKKYLASYFERFDNVWAHGDFAEKVAHNDNGKTYTSLIIHGRSDAILNPGGVRIGTAEIYRQVEKIEEVLESIAVGQTLIHDPTDIRVILFVRLREHVTLSSELENRIKNTIRQNTTPRHVPAIIVQVSDIPRTLSGKIVEIAVRETIHGRPVKNKDALLNPEALDLFKNLSQLEQ
ncbi:acetoacetate--CoA ligase [Oceaniserpentilla sp. 4NH20-0058]|uniref:acetoacetate--CoA ligase n=1 Tax=Oceaniserpentilla sp. 4NH20-0058 TaxID=3127660 RepID=UPI00310A71E1